MWETNDIMWIDTERGIPSATIAKYGLTLNSLVTEIIRHYDLARIGFHKLDKTLIIAVSTLAEHGGKVPQGWFLVNEKINQQGYFRLNNKDLARIVARFAGLDLSKKNRFLVELDQAESRLVINLADKLEVERKGSRDRRDHLDSG